jgi:hypothetical protein
MYVKNTCDVEAQRKIATEFSHFAEAWRYGFVVMT